MFKPTITVMVGLPSSGKSTYIKEVKGKFKDCVILSSDAIREELFEGRCSPEDNQKVFDTLYTRMQMALNTFKDVVIDATNITYKSRRQIFDRVNNIPCNINAIVMGTPIEKCLERNKNRDNQVPEEVIQRMYKHYQHPQYFEGFDEILIMPSMGFDKSHEYLTNLLTKTVNFDQQNRHHKYPLYKHCDLVELNLIELMSKSNKSLSETLCPAGWYHDIGKVKTQKWNEEKQEMTYHEHHNVGTYDLMTCFPILSYIFLPYMGRDIRLFNEFLFYINYHMLPYNLKKEKTINKYKERFGECLFDNLMLLHEADKKAH